MPLCLTGQEERGECLGSPGRARPGMGCPQGLQPLQAQQGACGQGTRDLPLLLPSPPACLPQADPDQTLEGRELRRGSSQGPIARIQQRWAWTEDREDAERLAHRTCESSHILCSGAPTRRQESRQQCPFQAQPGLGTHSGEGASRGDGGRLWGAWESRWCFKREISGGLEVSEQGGGKRRAVL